MLDASQPWNLFGYDVRRVPHYFRAGWHDFLWGDASPVLAAIDEVVAVRQPSGEWRHYRAGSAVASSAAPSEVLAQAVLLPDRLALCKTLRVPAAAEADLDSMLALEVNASSPFPKADTCHGHAITDRQPDTIEVQLVISAKSAVMAYISENLGSHDAGAYEVWAQAAGRFITLPGFGEAPRRQRSRGRLVRLAATLGYCAVAVMLVFAVAAGMKYLQLQQARTMLEQVERDASAAVEMRTALAASKARLETINKMLASYPSPHRELARLSRLLDDGTWLAVLDMHGATIRIEGESGDASAVMQQLLEHPAYARVEAPVASRKSGPGSERFVLKLTLADAENAR